MEIDVFYQNDDMSFGFDGMSKLDKDAFAFAKKAQYGFTDIDYSYANGQPDGSWGSREQDAYKWRFGGWKTTYKKDCKMLEKYIDGCKKQIKKDEEEMMTADANQKRVLSGYYEKAECSLKKTKAEEEAFQTELSLAKGNSKVGTYVLVGSVVLLVGVIGFLAYRRFKQ
jgi:hypothetical protein